MQKIRILLADDHVMTTAGLRKLLEPEYEVVGVVEDGRALLKATADLRPDVVLLDIGMPLMNGLDAARELKRLNPSLKLIFLTMNADSSIASEAFRAGASAYLLKTSHPSELLRAVHNVVRGISYVTPQIRQAMEERFIRDPQAVDRPKQLSQRQREVLQMIAEGRSLMEIASLLHISYRTARFHKARIMEELDATTISDLVKYAIKSGVVCP